MSSYSRMPIARLPGGAASRFLAALLLGLPVVAQAATLVRTTAFDYSSTTGLLTKEIVEPGNSNLCLVTAYTYDAYGNKLTAATRNCNGSPGSVPANSEAAAPSGDAVIAPRSTSNTYDARGQFPTASYNALNQSESKTFDPRSGAVLSLTSPNGLTTTWTYDSFGRKTRETRADGNQTRWDYLYCTGINGGIAACPSIGGDAGAYVVVTTPLASDGVTQNGPAGKAYYDALDRPIRSETQGFDGSGTGTAVYQDTQYDSLGRAYMKSRPYYAGQTAYWSTVTYDSLGRPIQIVEADGSTAGTSYNGLAVTVTNAKSQTRTTVKNSQGQIVAVTDAQNQTLVYQYDPYGKLTQTTDPLGNVITLTYDLRGRKTGMHDPDMGNWTYAYDALGQLIRQTDAKGQVTLMSYDLLGRMINRSEADLISNWYYDAYKNGGACNKGIGRLCQAETSTGYVRIHTFDALGRPLATSTSIDTAYTSSVTYDGNGRLATQTYPSSVAVNYLYTALGYLKEIRDSQTNALYWQANSLDAEGHLLLQTYGNTVQTQQTYNPANGRITGIVAGAGNAVQNLAYTYDSLGNIASRTDANQSLTESFLYDTLNRLTSATVNSSGAGIVTQSFTYDALGNIVSRSDFGAYTYPASGASSVGPHAVSRIDLAAGGYRTYSFDANGNLANEAQYDASNNPVANKGRTEAYTSFNMPQAFGSPLVSAGYQYGPEHQRVMEVSSSAGTTIYLNPGNNGDLLYEQLTKSDNTFEQRSYLTAYGVVVGVVKKVTQSGTTTNQVLYYHRDNLGSTTAVTDATGTVIERLAYEPFGKRRFPAGTTDPNNTIVGVNGERGFTNHEHIDELGLIHMNGRIYDPAVGRFVSPDPQIQDPNNLQSYNRYSYVLNNPLFYTDPSGYSWLSKAWHKVWHSTVGRIAVTVAVAYFTGYYNGGIFGANGAFASVGLQGTELAVANGAAGGFAGGFVGSGGNLKAGVIGGLTGAAMGYVGSEFPAYGENVAAHAVVGCASSSLSGGNCGSGALAGGFSAAAAPLASDYGVIGGTIASAVIGGTASVIGGGKFANGAETGAFGYLFNCVQHGCQEKVQRLADSLSNENTVRTFSFFYPSDANPVTVGQINAAGKSLAADLVVSAAEVQRVGNIVAPFVGANPTTAPKSFVNTMIDSIKGYFSPSLQFSSDPKVYAGQLRETFGYAARNQSALVHKFDYETYKQGQ